MKNKLTCLFGFHDYSDELTKDKNNNSIYLCKICKLNGHYKNSNGREYWYDYDDKGNRIHYKNSDGYECWYDYDDKGNRIHYKSFNGFECWYEYDDKSNIIHWKNSNEFEYWYDYDDKGNEIHWKNSNGYEQWLHNGKWVDDKPENWEYGKYVK